MSRTENIPYSLELQGELPSDCSRMLSAELQWPSVWAHSIKREYVLESKDILWDLKTHEISGSWISWDQYKSTSCLSLLNLLIKAVLFHFFCHRQCRWAFQKGKHSNGLLHKIREKQHCCFEEVDVEAGI